ncbi:replication initiation protein [Vibrio astriarenae]
MSKPKKSGVSRVTKPHDIITAKFSLSPREQDLVTMAFMEVKKFADRTKVEDGQFDPDKPETLTAIPTIFTFEEKKVAEMLKMTVRGLHKKDEKNGKSYLQNICTQLVSRHAEDSPGDDTFLVASLISEAEFSNGKLTLEVTRRQAARMLQYGQNQSNFGVIDAKLLLGFKSGYSKRILEIISRFKNKREYTCTLGDLCGMLGTSIEEHTDFARFRRNIIERPLKQIIEDSDGVWTAKEGYKDGYVLDTKRGKRVTLNNKVTFKMRFNDPDAPSKKTSDKTPIVDLAQLVMSFAITGVGELDREQVVELMTRVHELEGTEFDADVIMSHAGKAVTMLSV